MKHKKLLILTSVIVLGSFEATQIVRADEQNPVDTATQDIRIPESGPQTSAATQIKQTVTTDATPTNNQATESATNNQEPALTNSQIIPTAEPNPAASEKQADQGSVSKSLNSVSDGTKASTNAETATGQAQKQTTQQTSDPEQSQTTADPTNTAPSQSASTADSSEQSAKGTAAGKTDQQADSISQGQTNPPAETAQTNEASQNPTTDPTTGTETAPRLEDDFYTHINYEWFKKTEISDGSLTQSSMMELQNIADANVKESIKRLLSGEEESCIEGMDDYLKFYKKATDFEQRELDGIEPVKPYLEAIEELSGVEDLAAETTERVLHNQALPYSISVFNDLENSDQKMIWLSAPETILDEETYQDESKRIQILTSYKESSQRLLTAVGYTQEEAAQITEQAAQFENLVAPYIPSADKRSNLSNLYNPRTAEEVKAYSPELALNRTINELVKQKVEKINVSHPTYFEHLHEIINKQNLAAWKSWLLVNEISSHIPYLTEELRQLALELNPKVIKQDKEDEAIRQTKHVFSELWSVYYGQNFLDDRVKEDVTAMTAKIVEAYKERLLDNTWLSQSTKEKAIEKLDHMTYFIGAPKEVSDIAKRLFVEDDYSYFDNIKQLSAMLQHEQFSSYNEPVDKNKWPLEAYSVNAAYDLTNSIYIPAAIINGTFYDANQSEAANFGGIGVVIGHEITHAFDSNGSRFDEDGNLNNWWTDKDQQAFDQKLQAMVQLFDGLNLYGSKVNSNLTLTENTADAGGLAVALAALQKENPEANLTEFFENYARLWRDETNLAIAQEELASDVHSPEILRANVQLANSDVFQKTYNIQPTDGMYMEPDKQVVIW